MIALAWLLIIAVASLLVVRLGTTALVLTGLPRHTSEFQAYSAFFGVGFTTRESEQVVNHPLRRRIVQHLILAGQVGLTSVIVPLVVTFVNVHSLRAGAEQLGLLVGSLAALWFVMSTTLFESLVDRSIKFALRRTRALVPSPDHAVLLRIHAGYAVSEIALEPGAPLVGGTLATARLADRGILVLGITRGEGAYLGAPPLDTLCGVGDVLTVYGRDSDVNKLVTFLERKEAAG
jgi:hypothetical protein